MIETTIREKLDNVLLPKGILSFDTRRVETDSVQGLPRGKINNDEYVVFRIISNRPTIYGDGNAFMSRIYVDITYYYSYDKNDAKLSDVMANIALIKAKFAGDKRFILENDVTPTPDIDSPYRGYNIEYKFIGIAP